MFQVRLLRSGFCGDRDGATITLHAYRAQLFVSHVSFASPRLSDDDRSDGFRARKPAGRPSDSGRAAERAGFDPYRLQLRAGDQAPASAGERPAIALTLYPQVALYTVLHSDNGERC